MIGIVIAIVQFVVVGVLSVIVTLQAATIRKLQGDQAERERFRREAQQRRLEVAVLSEFECLTLNRLAPRSRPH